MSFLLRSFLTVALVGSLAGSSLAQTTPAAPTTPASASPGIPAAVSPAAAPGTGPLLPPIQVAGSYKDYLNQRYAADKEARAVIHLFGRKKTGGTIWLLTGVGVVGLVASQTGTRETSTGTSTTTVTPLGYGLLVGLFGGVGIGKLARFSNEKLYTTLAEYDKSHAFSGSVMEKLAAKDYQ